MHWFTRREEKVKFQSLVSCFRNPIKSDDVLESSNTLLILKYSNYLQKKSSFFFFIFPFNQNCEFIECKDFVGIRN